MSRRKATFTIDELNRLGASAKKMDAPSCEVVKDVEGNITFRINLREVPRRTGSRNAAMDYDWESENKQGINL